MAGTGPVLEWQVFVGDPGEAAVELPLNSIMTRDSDMHTDLVALRNLPLVQVLIAIQMVKGWMANRASRLPVSSRAKWIVPPRGARTRRACMHELREQTHALRLACSSGQKPERAIHAGRARHLTSRGSASPTEHGNVVIPLLAGPGLSEP